MKGVQCYELFGGIALKNHAFSFHFISLAQVKFALEWFFFSLEICPAYEVFADDSIFF